jgi:hypothetical protein
MEGDVYCSDACQKQDMQITNPFVKKNSSDCFGLMRPENWVLFCVPAIFHFHEESFPPTPITMLPVQKKGTSKKRALHAIY